MASERQPSRGAAIRRALLALALVGGTACGFERPPCRVTIDFAAQVAELGDREVVVDGLVVGRLHGPDGAARASFPVGPGSHEIRIRHPRLGSDGARVTAPAGSRQLRLVADIEETWTAGRLEPRIVLR